MRPPSRSGPSRAAARCHEALLFIALQASVARAPLRRTADQGAGIGGQIDVPFAPRRVDRVREHVEFSVDGRPGDDFQALIAIFRGVYYSPPLRKLREDPQRQTASLSDQWKQPTLNQAIVEPSSGGACTLPGGRSVPVRFGSEG